jgi:hypothetical protein
MPISEIGDLSGTFLGVLAIFVGSGYYVFDDATGAPAGALLPALPRRHEGGRGGLLRA